MGRYNPLLAAQMPRSKHESIKARQRRFCNKHGSSCPVS